MAQTVPSAETLKQIKACCAALEDKKAIDLVVLDVSGSSSITDFFILATGNSEPHLRALRGSLEGVLKDLDIPVIGIDYHPQSGWLVVDAFDFMVHLFIAEVRESYHIEALWRDAKQITL